MLCVLQSASPSGSSQQLPTPFARQGSQGVEMGSGQAPPVAAAAAPRREEGAGAFSRAASMPAPALPRSASGQHEDTLRLGEAASSLTAQLLPCVAELLGSALPLAWPRVDPVRNN